MPGADQAWHGAVLLHRMPGSREDGRRKTGGGEDWVEMWSWHSVWECDASDRDIYRDDLFSPIVRYNTFYNSSSVCLLGELDYTVLRECRGDGVCFFGDQQEVSCINTVTGLVNKHVQWYIYIRFRTASPAECPYMLSNSSKLLMFLGVVDQQTMTAFDGYLR